MSLTEEMWRFDMFVALTNDDENNIMSALWQATRC